MKIKTSFFNELRKKKINFECNVSGTKLTSIGIGGTIDCVIYPTNLDKLKEAVYLLRDYRYNYYKIGNGTNIILSDNPKNKVALSMKKYKKVFEIMGNRLLITAGYSISYVARKLSQMGYTGWEYAIGIPGLIGGGVKTNAGAFNGYILKDLLYIWCIDKYGDLLEINKENIKYSYRYTNIPERYIIYRVLFSLKRGKQTVIDNIIKNFKKYRNRTQPKNVRSAGSIFRNPPGNSAGKLIEECGLKGRRVGGCMISEKHANYIINVSGGSYSDIIKLIDLIKREVYKRFKIKLQLEVNILV